MSETKPLGERLRAVADYQDRPGAHDELLAMADEADAARAAHQRDVENLGAANVKLAAELDELRAEFDG